MDLSPFLSLAAGKPPVGKLRLGDLNVLPAGAKAIPKWRTHDEGWTDAARGVERAAEALNQDKPRSPRRGALPD